MRRIRRVYAVRRAAPVVLASLAFGVVTLWALGREVWVSQVYANMPSFFDVPAITGFMTYAFIHTDLAVQVLCVALLLAVVGLAQGCARLLGGFGKLGAA